MPTTTMMSPLEERLRVEVREELEKSIKAKLEAEYQAELARMQEAERTRFEDKLAKYQKDCERDFDGRLDAEAERLWRNRRDEFLDRLELLKERTDEAETRATTLAEGLRALATAIWPELDRFKAVGRHLALTEIDMAGLAPGLQAIGMRIAARQTDSEHSVMLRLPHGAQAVHLLALKRDLPRTTDPRHEELAIDAPTQ